MKAPKRGDLVHVKTSDIEHASPGWSSFAEVAAAKPTTYEAVGWVVKVRKRTLTLSALTSSDGKAHCYYLLPRGGITSIRRLK